MASEGFKAAFNKFRMDLAPFSRSFAFRSAPSGSWTCASRSAYASGSGAGNRAGFARVPSSVDGTDVTPSLASDNDAESLLLFEDRAVRTPPPPMDSAPAIAIRTPAPRQEDAILAEENHEIDDEVDVDPSPFRRTFPKTPLPSNARHSTSPFDSDSASPPMQISELFDPLMSEKARGKQRASDANQGSNDEMALGSVFTKRKPSATLDRPTPPRARPPRRVPRASSPPTNASFDFSRREEEEESDGVDDDGFRSQARASTNSSMAASTTSRGSILSASTAAREGIVSKSRIARSLIPKRVFGGGNGNGRVNKVVVRERMGSRGSRWLDRLRRRGCIRLRSCLRPRLGRLGWFRKEGLRRSCRSRRDLSNLKLNRNPHYNRNPSNHPLSHPPNSPNPKTNSLYAVNGAKHWNKSSSKLPLACPRVDYWISIWTSRWKCSRVQQQRGMRMCLKRRGCGKAFMAYGGAGGSPVRMGRGYVRGASLDDN
ncbi:hypothetical protein PENSPDRAFT_659545 [Peniophora sp. CONT]|nr:hypothetical protein PENSPDRAFT_659545 [Peniophora sp. CONT]